MLHKQEEVMRVGIRVVVVAAVVGLIVLLFAEVAYPQELASSKLVKELLIRSAPPTVAEQVEAVETLLRADKRRKTGAIHFALVEAAWQVLNQASPKRLLRSGERLFRRLRNWGKRSPAEDHALEMLEAEIQAGSEDPKLWKLYGKLRLREDRARVRRSLAQAEHAIEQGNLRAARRWLARTRELDPESAKLEKLRRVHDEREREALAAAEAASVEKFEELAPWEVAFAAALLTGRYDSALEFDAVRADLALGQAVASYLSGDRDRAFEVMRDLSELEGRTGRLAERWLEDATLNPEGPDLSPVKRLLAKLEWNERESDGLLLPRERPRPGRAMRSLELAFSLPKRVVRTSKAAGKELRKAALRKLHLVSESPHEERPPVAWEDGFLVLPPARTRYASAHATPVLVSRAALELLLGERALSVAPELAETEAILLEPLRSARSDEARALDVDSAQLLVSVLARGIEDGKLRPYPDGQGKVIESIRRLDIALQSGVAISARSWSPRNESMEPLHRSLIRGRETQLKSFAVSRKKRGLRVAKDWIGREMPCPEEMHCVDRSFALRGTLYGRLDLSKEARVGARTSFYNAKLALEVSRSGPRASLVLPLAAWLGLAQWIPFEAHLDISLAGISLGPHFVAAASSSSGR